MKIVNIYTDGACRGNPGKGGWGAVLEYGGKSKEIYGGDFSTTNNKMELKAVIEALRLLTEPCKVTLTTDSKYVIQGITEWISGWKKNNWKNSSKQDVKNKDLWIELDNCIEDHNIVWQWVKGHSGHEGNERADELANKGIDTL
jgi:ribonuclease HI